MNKKYAWAAAGVVMVAMTARAQVEWSTLDRHQATMTADTFSRLLAEVYAPEGGLVPYLRYGENKVAVYSTPDQSVEPLFVLRFGETDQPPARPAPSGPLPLSGLRIALDPGHIGGAWARMEERFFLVDRATDWPVQEAALNLHVAHLLRDRLSARGATVLLVKEDFEPMSDLRPDAALAAMTNLPPADPRFAHLPPLFIEAARLDARRKRAEQEFFRTAEIKARAARVNNELRPDLTLCIHFNATGYGDEKTLYDANGLVFFVQGNFLPGELIDDEQKFHLLSKLLERSRDEELALSRAIADAFVAATGLPPSYPNFSGRNMKRMDSDYIYARNLAANRLFRGPVIFLEPYFMNNRTTYARIQAGDYDGVREIDGKPYPSIFREYADAVAAGVERYYVRPSTGD